MNSELALHSMIEQQIRPWNVLDQRVLDALAQYPREQFVPNSQRALAFADTSLPLSDTRNMLTPCLEARLTQELKLRSSDKCLIIGINSVYIAVLLQRIAANVLVREPCKKHQNLMQDLLKQGGIESIQFEDLAYDAPCKQQYDVIIATGSVHHCIKAWQDMLTHEGRLVVVEGSPQSTAMQATLHERYHDVLVQTPLFETYLPPLDLTESNPQFEL